MAIDFPSEIASLQQTFASIREVSDVEQLKSEVAELTEAAAAPDLWDDPDVAQEISTLLSGEFDERSAEITVRSGAGGDGATAGA